MAARWWFALTVVWWSCSLSWRCALAAGDRSVQVRVASPTGASVLYANEAVVVTVEVTLLNNENASSLRVWLDAGDGGAAREVLWGSDAVVLSYGVSGLYSVSARVSAADSGATLTSSAQRVRIEPARPFCVQLVASGGPYTMLPGSEIDVALSARLLRSAGRTYESLGSVASLTQELVALGERPRVQVDGDPDLGVGQLVVGALDVVQRSNDTIGDWLVSRVSAAGDGWVVRLRAGDWAGGAWLSVESLLRASLNGDCGVLSSRVFVAVTPLAQLCAAGGATACARSSAPSGALAVPAHLTSWKGRALTQVASHACLPSVAVALASGSGVRPQLLATTSAFDQFRVVELDELRWGAPGALPAQPLAQPLAGARLCETHDCNELTVSDVRFVGNTHVVLASSAGLLALELISLQVWLLGESGAWRASSRSFCVGETGPDNLQGATSYHLGAFFLRPGGGLHVRTVAGAGSELVERVLARDTSLVDRLFASPAPATGSSTLQTNDLLAVPSSDLLLVLMGEPNGTSAFVGLACDGQSEEGTSCVGPRLGFVFPPQRVVLGACPHAAGIGVLAYGDALWLSLDSGRHFSPLLALPAGERVEGCPVTGPVHGALFVRTSRDRLFYGQLDAAGMAELGTSRGALPALDDGGVLRWLRLVGEGSEQRLTRAEQPVVPVVSVARTVLGGPVALSRDGQGGGARVSLWCDQCFAQQHVGMLVEPLGLVTDVDASTGVAVVAASPGLQRQAQGQGTGAALQQVPLPKGCGLLLTNLTSAEAGASGPSFCSPSRAHSVNVSVPQGEACSGGLALVPLGATLQLSPALGGAVLMLGDRSADNSTARARCVLGALPAAASAAAAGWLVAGGDWGAVQTTGQLVLSFPPCRITSLIIEPHDAAPVVQLMDRFDLFLWQAAFAAPVAESNHALELKTALAWSDWTPGLERASELRVMQANSAFAAVTVHEFAGSDQWDAAWSLTGARNVFRTYQRVFPARARQVNVDEGKPALLNQVLHVEPNGKQSGTTMSMLLSHQDTSLSCPASAGVTRVLVRCPPYKSIVYKPPPTLGVKTLPANYRPPSRRGVGIPLTPHVYNADPAQPLERTWYKASRDSAVFKQCAAPAKTRRECACTQDDVRSRDVLKSDCIEEVDLAPYSDLFVPAFDIVVSAQLSVPFQSGYLIRDVNGRADFCTNKTGFDTARCGETDMTNVTLHPSDFDAILFVGEGLYHFEVTIEDPISLCDLKTHIVVFVIDPPLSPRKESITVALTAVLLILLAMAFYLRYLADNFVVERDLFGGVAKHKRS
jgi:hypothetical protein